MKESVRARDIGVGGSHSHPCHVDIRVGTCMFYLNVFGCHYMCT